MENYKTILKGYNNLIDLQILLNKINSTSEIFSTIPQRLSEELPVCICSIFGINKFTNNLTFCCNSVIDKDCEEYFNLNFLNNYKQNFLNTNLHSKIVLENNVILRVEPIGNNDDYIYFIALGFKKEDITDQNILERYIELIKGVTSKNFILEKLQAKKIVYDNFIRKLSHEIKTPLKAICEQAKILQNQNRYDYQSLDRIVYSGNHILSIVNDILKNKPVDSLREEIKKTEFASKKVIEDTFASMKVILSTKNLNMSFKNIDATIFADVKMFRQLVFNLAANAIKYSYPGTEIEVISYLSENKFWLEVKNHGQSISDSDKERIFDLYEQGSQSKETKKMGSGVGLHVCKRIAEAHDGTITCNNEVENETTFIISLACENIHSLTI